MQQGDNLKRCKLLRAQQEQINQAQTQAAQAHQMAKASQTQQAPNPSKKNMLEELERIQLI